VKNHVYFQNLNKLIAILFNILSPHYLYTVAYEFSFVQSNAAAHQLTPCSAGPPFFISPHGQTENEFLSMHFSVWETGKSHGGAKYSKWGEGGQALECTCWLKTALRGCCELVHCLDAESISSSTIPALSSSHSLSLVRASK
jgi:hypothetical protein